MALIQPHTANQAEALNAALSQLWQAESTHSKLAFQKQIAPLYTALLDVLRTTMRDTTAQNTVLALLQETTQACNYRWSVRLPMRRPGSDYRKYESIYTYALITAMAVETLKQQQNSKPETLIHAIVSEEGVGRLQADPTVWEDWLGYFDKAEIGGLYQVAKRQKTKEKNGPTLPAPRENTTEIPVFTRSEQPAGAGRAMMVAIREALQDGSLSYNQPGDVVQVDRQGRTFLEHPAILQWCVERLELSDDFRQVNNRFNRLKILKRSSGGQQFFRGRLRARDPICKGYVVEEGGLLWQSNVPAGRFVIENITK